MMRRPSTSAELYAWHRQAVRGSRPPVHEGIPECGWFKTRMTKGGPWVPVRIWCEREVCPLTGELVAPEILRCEADGQMRNPARLWTYLLPISREEHAALSERRVSIPAMQATMVKINLSQEAMRP